MATPGPDRDPEGDPSSLAAQLAELANRPVGDRWIDRARSRAIAWAERATSWGPFKPVAELGWRTARRDASVGGSVLAAALAYRIFIWLLPLTLVLVLGVGWFADASGVLGDAGVGGYVASSVSAAAENVRGWARVTGVVAGLLVLLYETYALLRGMRAVTAIAWRLPVRPTPRPSRDTLLFFGWVVAFSIAGSSGAAVRKQLEFPADVVAWIGTFLLLSALYLALAWWLLPHTAERPRELVPGALVVGAAVILIGLFNSIFLFPWLAQRQETYGVLGVAAGLLFSFFLIGRTVELSASLNGVLADRRQERRLAR